MLLTITTTHQPATDLGYLLHKNPANLNTVTVACGVAHIFYPEATEECCTAALLLDMDAVELVRRPASLGHSFALDQYVNDRPYAATSFLSVALNTAFGTALAGRCNAKPELVDKEIPLRVHLPIVPCRGGESVLRRLFEPLGYDVTAAPHLIDDRYPEWGDSRYFTVELTRTCRLREFLAHLYVLIPVLDNDKHYWIGDAEVEKLIRFGEGWLSTHPDKDLITRRYLKHQKSLTSLALERLTEETEDELAEPEDDALFTESVVPAVSLNEMRLTWAIDKLRACGAKTVIDMGCGEGKLLQRLVRDTNFEKISGCDVSIRALEKARSRLRFDRLSTAQQSRITLIQTALTYRDRRLAGYDAAALIEVVEHLDPSRMGMFERAVFGFATPGTVLVTTPNAEYNALYESLPAGQFRHDDHRFEWTRTEFQGWATRVAEEFGYQVEFEEIGPADDIHGSPTQAAVFKRRADNGR